jgi:hypothetical protein
MLGMVFYSTVKRTTSIRSRAMKSFKSISQIQPQALPVKSVSVLSCPQVQAPDGQHEFPARNENLPLARFPQMQASPLTVFSWVDREQVHSPAARFPASEQLKPAHITDEGIRTNRMSKWQRQQCSP